MRPDGQATATTPGGSASFVERRSLRASLQAGPISLVPRTLDPAIAAALDGVPPDHLPRLRAAGDEETLRRSIRNALAEVGFAPAWLSDWLLEDVIFLVRLYRDLIKVRKPGLRLEAVETDACSQFHADNVGFRLVTTYRGPGTEWLHPHTLALLPKGAPIPADCVRRLDRGDVAILRGSRNASAERPALIHRSPPIAGSGVRRLFLAIDEGLHKV